MKGHLGFKPYLQMLQYVIKLNYLEDFQISIIAVIAVTMYVYVFQNSWPATICHSIYMQLLFVKSASVNCTFSR